MNTLKEKQREYPRLLIISPVKDEAEYLEKTIKSVTSQTCLPKTWVIVNDGSKDRTGEIADQAAKQYPWIKVVHRQGGTQRRVGPGVIEAFNVGLSQYNLEEYNYVCKLDGDLKFNSNYFETCYQYFQDDPRLGTVSGKCYVPENGTFVLERTGDQFSHGVAKLYRTECYQQIGGFVQEVMWDGIDCHQCRILGWQAKSVSDPNLKIVHLRQMGTSHKSIYVGRRRWGRGQYFMGTHLLYILFVSIYRMFEKPYILGGLNIFLGYLHSWFAGIKQYNPPGFRRYLHRWQYEELKSRLYVLK